jgi:hypothetical protein
MQEAVGEKLFVLWQGCATATAVYQFASQIHAAVEKKDDPP